jgi:signal transduction histidine kinase
LSNIKKHANASEVTVQLSYNPDAVFLDIQDNGQGFDHMRAALVTQQGGFGLNSMEQRARLLGGTLKVNSRQGFGTKVEARIPIR